MIEAALAALVVGTFLRSWLNILIASLVLGVARTMLLRSMSSRYGDQWTDERTALAIALFTGMTFLLSLAVRAAHLWRLKREDREN